MNRIRTILASGLAMALSGLPPIAHSFDPSPYVGWRERPSRRHNPAGTKLARKARKGQVGKATIR